MVWMAEKNDHIKIPMLFGACWNFDMVNSYRDWITMRREDIESSSR